MKKLLLLFLAVTFFVHADEPIEEHAVVVLGGGVGALTAATYLGRAGLNPLVITGPVVGGAIIQSHSVQNWPGEIEIAGSELIDRMQAQAETNGAILRAQAVVAVDFSKRPFLLTVKDAFQKETKKIRAQSCIIALGALPNMLGVPGEMHYWTKGVYSCAVCDGALYKDKVVAVVGGGDSAITEAHYLANIAKKVIVLVRKDKLKGVEELRKKEVLTHPNVEVRYDTVVEEIVGNGDKVSHLRLKSSAGKEDLPVDALFLAIGSKPNTELFQGQLELDSYGYIALKNQQETSVPGVYAIGDIVDPEFKQAVTAAGDGAKAALQLQKMRYSPTMANNKAKNQKKAPPPAGNIVNISSAQNLLAECKQATGPVFLYFYSTSCAPCRTFSMYYDRWAKDFGDKISFMKVNVKESQDAYALVGTYNVQVIPTILILDKNGNVLQKKAGTKDLSDLNTRLEMIKGQPEVDLNALR